MNILKNHFKKIIVLIITIFMCFSNVLAATPNISVTGLKVESKTDGITVGSIGFDTNTITADAVLKNLDDYVTYKITIKNSDKQDYTIKNVTDDNDSEYVKTTYTSDSKISSGKTANIYMTFKLEKLVDKIADIDDDDFYNLGKIDITVTLVDSNNNTSNINITTNPNTSDNIVLYIGLLVLAVIGIAFAVLMFKRNKKSVGYLVIAGLILITVPTYASQRYDINLIFADNNIKVKVDTYNIKRMDTDDEIKVISNQDYILNLDEPSKRGYDFEGWTTTDGGQVEYHNGDVINGDHDLEFYPVFKIINYPLTINTNGANETNLPTSYTVEDEVNLPNLTKDGYTFDGWTGSNGNTPQKDLKIEKGTIGEKEYNANFTINSYAITFHDTETGQDTVINKTYHSTLSNSDAPEIGKEGYTYYWSLNENGEAFDFSTPIEEGMTLYSVYKITQNTVTINDDNRTRTMDVDYGTTIGSINSLGKEGYTFKHWKEVGTGDVLDPSTRITSPISIEAVYEKDTYNLTYDENNGNQPVVVHYQIDSPDISLPNPTKEGYTFVGWDKGDGNAPQKDVIVPTGSTGDITYTAVYEKEKYTLTYNKNDGSDPVVVDYYVDSNNITLPNPTRTGYVFIGWDKGDGSAPQKDVVVQTGSTGNKTYNAVWEKATITSVTTTDDLTDFVAGNTITLTADVDLAKYADQVTWTSSNPSAASIQSVTVQNGKSIAVIKGLSADSSVVITAKIEASGSTVTTSTPVKKAIAYLPEKDRYYSSLQKGINAVSPTASTDNQKTVELLANTAEMIDVTGSRSVIVDFKNHTVNGRFKISGGSYADIHSGTITFDQEVALWVSGRARATNMNLNGSWGILVSDPDTAGNGLKDSGGNFLTGDAYNAALENRATAYAINCTINGSGFDTEVRFESTLYLNGCNIIGTGTDLQIPNIEYGNNYVINDKAGRIYYNGTLYRSTYNFT